MPDESIVYAPYWRNRLQRCQRDRAVLARLVRRLKYWMAAALLLCVPTLFLGAVIFLLAMVAVIATASISFYITTMQWNEMGRQMAEAQRALAQLTQQGAEGEGAVNES